MAVMNAAKVSQILSMQNFMEPRGEVTHDVYVALVN
jgi:hypothetical protein